MPGDVCSVLVAGPPAQWRRWYRRRNGYLPAAAVLCFCAGRVVWHRGDGLGFCAAHRAGHVHLFGVRGVDLGWWRVEITDDRDLFFLLDDDRRDARRCGAVYLDGRGRWSVTGVPFDLDYGPAVLAWVLAPAVRYAVRARRARDRAGAA